MNRSLGRQLSTVLVFLLLQNSAMTMREREVPVRWWQRRAGSCRQGIVELRDPERRAQALADQDKTKLPFS